MQALYKPLQTTKGHLSQLLRKPNKYFDQLMPLKYENKIPGSNEVLVSMQSFH